MQQETLRELVDRLLRFTGESPTDADARAIAVDVCANAVFSIWLKHPFQEFVMPGDLRLATVASQATYILPPYFGRVASKDGIVRNLTTGVKIFPITQRELEETYPDIGSAIDTTTSDPQHYTIAGKVGVNVQVATAGEALEVVSDNAADVDVLATVEGILGGQWTTTQVTLNGLVAVALGTWTYVQTCSKSYPNGTTPATALTSSRGTVTFRVAAAGATRQTLLPVESSREQYQFRLHQTPQSVQTIGIPTIRLPRRLFHDGDVVPSMWGPAVFEQMHIDYSVNRGELSIQAAAQLPRPELERLIGYDNERKPAVRMRKIPFGGWR